jgi:hypothetical protein
MVEADKAALYQLVADVHKYYRQPATEFTLSVWWTACQPFDLEQVQKAMTIHVMSPDGGQFLPKVADVVKVLQGTATDRAALAWGKVHEAMGSVGAYTDVVFDDPAIHAVIEDLGGWPKVCRTEGRELGYLQHRFCEGHRAYVGRGTFAYPRRLMGDRSPDIEWEKKGMKAPRALIGNPQTAQQVFEGGNLAGKTAITFSDLSQHLPKLPPAEGAPA